ncbi:heparan sulfate glucosamine 3-O-sulfotransferase 1-like isoform X1 [Clavelina lepadiformis]|uniref:heparan sulfate glucosamine 3-O-sulfotransferase 1-like isoform X1 n=1 Tax=Clavelina lepadiformis TaxID=159417 RepID=UPI004041D7EF
MLSFAKRSLVLLLVSTLALLFLLNYGLRHNIIARDQMSYGTESGQVSSRSFQSSTAESSDLVSASAESSDLVSASAESFDLVSASAESSDLVSASAQSSDRDVERQKLWLEIENSYQTQSKDHYLPKIIGIGTEKCGTFALFNFLRPHPMIRMGRKLPEKLLNDDFVEDLEIEAHFFDAQRNMSNLKAYYDKLPMAEEGAFVAEKSPAYFSFPPYFLPLAVRKVVPHTKLLLVLCDPVKRALSDFHQEWALLQVHRGPGKLATYKNFTSFLDVYLPKMTQEIGEWDETSTKYQILNVFRQHGRDYLTTILTTGLYALHLKRWFPYYDQSNLMIIDGGKLLSDPGPIIEEIQDFYDLPKLLLKEDYVRDPDTNYFCFKDWKTGELRRLPKSKQRTRNGKAKLTDEETVRLKSFYKTHNEALFKMLNRTFNWV